MLCDMLICSMQVSNAVFSRARVCTRSVARMGGCSGRTARNDLSSFHSASPPSIPEPAGPAPDRFDEELLRAHNAYRARHFSPALQWSSKAAEAARRWAQHLACAGRLELGDDADEAMGQNSARKFGGKLRGQETADLWYSEIQWYVFKNPGYSACTAHFTQMVWAGTTHMGCGRAIKDGTTYVVANYLPPGNAVGREQYVQNVKSHLTNNCCK